MDQNRQVAQRVLDLLEPRLGRADYANEAASIRLEWCRPESEVVALVHGGEVTLTVCDHVHCERQHFAERLEDMLDMFED
jgi:hypothetical protein